MANALTTALPLGLSFSIATTNAGQLLFITAPGGAGGVTSVFTRTGDVVAQNGDYSSTQVTNLSSVPGANVTAALNSLLAGTFQTPNTIGNLGPTETLAFDTNRYQIGTLDQNCVLTFNNSLSYEVFLELIQGGAGSFTVTWPATVDWTSGLEPTLSTAPGAIDIIKFIWNGSRWRGYGVAMALAP